MAQEPASSQEMTLSEVLDEHKRLSRKFWKTKADKRSLEVLETAAQQLIDNSARQFAAKMIGETDG